MGRLDCKTPSLIALKGLARDADRFVLISDAAVEAQLPVLAAAGLTTSPSGGAGAAAALGGAVPLGPDARVLCVISEGAV
jgi:diaminopropionate ammonia-lyase